MALRYDQPLPPPPGALTGHLTKVPTTYLRGGPPTTVPEVTLPEVTVYGDRPQEPEITKIPQTTGMFGTGMAPAAVSKGLTSAGRGAEAGAEAGMFSQLLFQLLDPTGGYAFKHLQSLRDRYGAGTGYTEPISR